MAAHKFPQIQLKAVVVSLLLALSATFTTSVRILDETVTSPASATSDPLDTPGPSVVPPGATAAAGVTTAAPGATTINAAGAATGAPGATTSNTAGAAIAAPANPAATAAAGGVAGAEVPDHSLSFFMHDILGGSNPSAIAVTGVVTNPAISGQVPFAKPNGAVLPMNNGVPVNNANSGIMNNNNLPFLTGLSGTRPNLMQNNNGNNIIGGGVGFPALNMGQLPSGTTFQKLMFGTMTVFDDELTEGHELGSGSVGKAQGFYVASSEDGLSQTMVFNVMFASGSYADSLSFFGVHRPAVSESHLAIMGGTGKYVNAKGFATVKTLPIDPNVQHNTDGLETVLQINVYLAY